jgi:hypothetical protein
MMLNDTHTDIYIKQLEIFLSKSDAERFQVCEELILFGRKILESNIIQENKDLSEINLKVEVFKRCYAGQFTSEELDRITDSMIRYFQGLKKDITI